MGLKPFIIFLFSILAGTAVFVLWVGRNAPVSASTPSPIVLTVMGKVADTNETIELKPFREFSAGNGVQIRFAQSLQTVNERIDLFVNLLRKHSPEPDLIDMDVIWPATLAPDLVDLKPFFQDEIRDFAPELLRNFTVNGRLIAIPTFVSVGVLYYRSDLLRKYGFHAPPKTWDQLDKMAAHIQAGERRSGNPAFWGYVWQGGAYESLTCNAIEWEASAGGGEILGADHTVRVRNPQFQHALARAVSWIGRISPPGQSAFSEDDGLNYWLAGQAAFMRGWTGQYAGIAQSTSAVRDSTSVAPMPGGEGGQRGALGGSGTGISKYSAHREQAIQLLKAIVSEQAEREKAILGGYIPGRIALRNTPAVMSKTPLHGTIADQVIQNVVARPALQAGSSYNRVSRAYHSAIHSVLTRETSPEEGLRRLEAELVKISAFRAVH